MTELHKPHVRPAGDRGMNTSCLLAPFNKRLWREQPSYRENFYKKKKKAMGEARFFSNNRAASLSHVMGHNRWFNGRDNKLWEKVSRLMRPISMEEPVMGCQLSTREVTSPPMQVTPHCHRFPQRHRICPMRRTIPSTYGAFTLEVKSVLKWKSRWILGVKWAIAQCQVNVSLT